MEGMELLSWCVGVGFLLAWLAGLWSVMQIAGDVRKTRERIELISKAIVDIEAAIAKRPPPAP